MEKSDKRKDTFDQWVADIPDVLTDFYESLPDDLSEKLDLSIESLDVLENWLLQNYSKKLLLKPENKNLTDCLARYVGEVFCENLPGAIWNIDLDNEKKCLFQFACRNRRA